MMSRIVGCVGTYNGVQFLPTALFHIHKYLDEIVIIDGVFRGFLASGFFKTAGSTDGTRQVVEALDLDCPLTWVDPPRTGWESHSHKRAAFFEYLEDGDWQYLINDDEIPIGDVEATFNELREEEEVDIGYVKFVEACGHLSSIKWSRNGVDKIPRFFRWWSDNPLVYGYCHIELTNRAGTNFRDWERKEFSGMMLVHLKRFRPKYERDRNLSDGNLYDVHVRGSTKILMAR